MSDMFQYFNKFLFDEWLDWINDLPDEGAKGYTKEEWVQWICEMQGIRYSIQHCTGAKEEAAQDSQAALAQRKPAQGTAKHISGRLPGGEAPQLEAETKAHDEKTVSAPSAVYKWNPVFVIA